MDHKVYAPRGLRQHGPQHPGARGTSRSRPHSQHSGRYGDHCDGQLPACSDPRHHRQPHSCLLLHLGCCGCGPCGLHCFQEVRGDTVREEERFDLKTHTVFKFNPKPILAHHLTPDSRVWRVGGSDRRGFPFLSWFQPLPTSRLTPATSGCFHPSHPTVSWVFLCLFPSFHVILQLPCHPWAPVVPTSRISRQKNPQKAFSTLNARPVLFLCVLFLNHQSHTRFLKANANKTKFVLCGGWNPDL